MTIPPPFSRLMPHPTDRPAVRAAALVLAVLALLTLLAIGARVLTAQVSGDRGIAAVVSSTDIDVGGIEVDERGKDGAEARANGWEAAQRAAWAKLGGPSLPDSQIGSMVSAIVIEREQVGPRRYIATLGVSFDRARAGRMLGAAGRRARSAPMLVVPVTISGGTETMYERRNPWQRAWAEYQAGASRVDYVRPSGAGADSLLLNFGQTDRRSRTWWRDILDQFGAVDVLVPIARLERQFPGGPVDGTFTARYGPDNILLGTFRMRAPNEGAVPAMMTKAVARFDTMFERALADGKLKPDPSLNLGPAQLDPAIAQLLAIGRDAVAQERREEADRRADAARRRADAAREEAARPAPEPEPTQAVASTISVQFATPDAGTVDAILAGVRATPGVRSAAPSSLAIGGTSVMSVTYAGNIAGLAAALRGRGFAVSQGGGSLSISR